MKAIVTLAALAIAGCAADVVRQPASLTDLPPAKLATLGNEVEIKFDTLYQRTLKPGSRWARVGQLPQGTVYRAVDGVFTVEGANVHEAYLVVSGGRLIGFYLPVERAFAPLANGPAVSLSD